MLKIAAITITILLICGVTFVIIPSALSFEDYITSESTIQEEAAEAEVGEGEEASAASEAEEVPVMGGGGSYYEESRDSVETIEEQEITEQDELRETEELKYEEELEK